MYVLHKSKREWKQTINTQELGNAMFETHGQHNWEVLLLENGNI